MGDVIISKKIIFLLLMVIIAIACVSAVNACDLNNTDVSDGVFHDSLVHGGPCDYVSDDILSHNDVTISYPDDIQAKIQIKESGQYYGEKAVTVKVINNSNTSLYPIPVSLKFSNGKSITVVTNNYGEAIYKLPFNPGKYNVKASVESNFLDVRGDSLKNIIIKNADAKITLKKLTTSYGSRKYLEIKVTNTKNNKGISGVKLLLKVYTNGKFKKTYLTTDSRGIAKYNVQNLNVGCHKVIVSEVSSGVKAKSKTGYVKVRKASVYFDGVDSIFIKKGGLYNVALFNKNNDKLIKGVKITIKILVGKKWNTYNLKTGKYGVDINLGYLGMGSYKVVAKFNGNSKYKKCIVRNYVDVIRTCGHILF